MARTTRKKTAPKPTPKPGPPKKKRPWTHVHLAIYLLFISGLLTIFISATLFLFISLNIPAISSLESYRPPITSLILDDQGNVVDRIFKQNRYVVPLSLMPDLLPNAFVAAEDARFFQHRGIDAWSILRALIHNIRSGSRAQGGSTITQQVARSLLLTPEKTYTRKVKEAILAYRIDHTLNKDEILHIYLNQIYLGEGSYGVEAAAQTYFDKNVQDLTLAEISLLAGLPQAPSRYSPFKHYKSAKKRQAYVLNRMAEDGYISATAARKAYKHALFWAPVSDSPMNGRYFIQQVRNYVNRKYSDKRLTTDGLTIHTTINRSLQNAATSSVRKGIARLVTRQNSGTSQYMSPQAALIALETRTGRIRAMVGGINFSSSQFNRAVQARRQPGSAFKPIIYAAALAKGLTPATIIEDEPLQLQGSGPGETWDPRNFSGTFHGPTTLRNGLVYSRNIVTIKILQEVGIHEVIKLAGNLGIRSPLAKNLSLALGSSGLSLLELTSAYSVFANGGNYVNPVFIKRIVDRDGNILEQNRPAPKPVLDERTAFQITHLMKQVIKEGTGKKARGLDTPSAGKTGTTDQNMDAWFIGYTPDIATGVWVGYDQKITLGSRETGSRAAAPIWLDFMKKAEKHFPEEDFKIPEGITFIPMNSETGEIENGENDEFPWQAFRNDNLPSESEEASCDAVQLGITN